MSAIGYRVRSDLIRPSRMERHASCSTSRVCVNRGGVPAFRSQRESHRRMRGSKSTRSTRDIKCRAVNRIRHSTFSLKARKKCELDVLLLCSFGTLSVGNCCRERLTKKLQRPNGCWG
jgi:hypothetical protein